MPFLRVIRDKRGYETTYLMHWFRDGNRQRSRILYVFRTPGGIRVGRPPLEPDVLREIEAQHPEIVFDWRAVRENQQVVEPAAEPRRRPSARQAAREGGEARRPKRAEREAEAAAADAAASAAPPEGPSPRGPAIPPAIEGTTVEEQIAFLNEWYPIARERILRRPFEPARQEALLALAERLNPAAWTEADPIATRLQHAAEALERLSRVFARRRRRSRRRSGEPAPGPGSAAAPAEPEPSSSES